MPPSRISVLLDEPIGRIRPELYGQFAEHLGACIDEGLWVGEDSAIPNLGGIRSDVLEALRKLHIPILRWPGGCYADDYHWEDGIGPRRERPRRVNIWWGETVECNHFGTHEFIRLCRYLGCQPFLAGNVGTGSPREMRDWVEYCNFADDSTLARRRGQNGSPMPFGVRYWGVGNEAWGCGGNFCPEDYAAEYRRFATYLRDFAGTPPLFLVACGPDGNKPEWTRRFLSKLIGPDPRWNCRVHAIGAHYYCGTAGPSATEYDANQWYELLERAAAVERLILDQRAVIDEFGETGRKIGLAIDEWGTWHFPTPGRNPAHLWQQSTLRDGLVAAITLDTFNRHADKLVMANLAQLVNVLQSLVLTEGERMLLTPTYHVFDLYQSHQGGQAVRTAIEFPAVSFAIGSERRQIPGLLGSASVRDRVLTLSVVNPHATLPAEVAIDLVAATSVRDAEVSVLTHDDLTAHNTFDEPDNLVPTTRRLDGLTAGARHVFPPASVTVLRGPLA
jgi:alpha-N-arabinofuranosidase